MIFLALLPELNLFLYKNTRNLSQTGEMTSQKMHKGGSNRVSSLRYC